jgi:hypothetical protein
LSSFEEDSEVLVLKEFHPETSGSFLVFLNSFSVIHQTSKSFLVSSKSVGKTFIKSINQTQENSFSFNLVAILFSFGLITLLAKIYSETLADA